jgi:hypothetical protein
VPRLHQSLLSTTVSQQCLNPQTLRSHTLALTYILLFRLIRKSQLCRSDALQQFIIFPDVHLATDVLDFLYDAIACTCLTDEAAKIEENMIVQQILSLCKRASQPYLAAVKDMASSSVVKRHRNLVGQNWGKTFVKRQLVLQVKYSRKCDYTRASTKMLVFVRLISGCTTHHCEIQQCRRKHVQL